jgi:hypothetical protein
MIGVNAKESVYFIFTVKNFSKPRGYDVYGINGQEHVLDAGSD